VTTRSYAKKKIVIDLSDKMKATHAQGAIENSGNMDALPGQIVAPL
jgi:hypothetical protein